MGHYSDGWIVKEAIKFADLGGISFGQSEVTYWKEIKKGRTLKSSLFSVVEASARGLLVFSAISDGTQS